MGVFSGLVSVDDALLVSGGMVDVSIDGFGKIGDGIGFAGWRFACRHLT